MLFSLIYFFVEISTLVVQTSSILTWQPNLSIQPNITNMFFFLIAFAYVCACLCHVFLISPHARMYVVFFVAIPVFFFGTKTASKGRFPDYLGTSAHGLLRRQSASVRWHRWMCRWHQLVVSKGIIMVNHNHHY